MSNHGWIGVDLDGTLAHYDGWQGIEHVGKPIPRMVNRIKTWLAEGKTVKIFTARVSDSRRDVDAVIAPIHQFCRDAGLPELEVTCLKDYGMIELWDDRAVAVVPNTGDIYGYDAVYDPAKRFELSKTEHINRCENPEDPRNQLHELQLEYSRFLSANDLPSLSADKLYHEYYETLTWEQRLYIDHFMHRWRTCEDFMTRDEGEKVAVS